MTPDDVVCLLALACPVEPLTAENAVITTREVEQLIELAVSMASQQAAAAEQRRRKRPRTESPLQAQAAQKPRVQLLALPMAVSHSAQKPRKALVALPMAKSHSYYKPTPATTRLHSPSTARK